MPVAGTTGVALCDEVVEYFKPYFTPDTGYDIRQIQVALARPPAISTVRVNTVRIDVDSALKLLNAHISEQYEKEKEENPESASAQVPVPFQVHNSVPDILFQPCSGPMNIQQSHKIVILDRKCAEAILRGADVYAPGVLYMEKAVNYGEVVCLFVDLDPSRPRGSFIEENEAEEIRKSSLQVGNGRMVMSRTDIFRENSGLAIKITDPVFTAPPLNNVFSDRLFLQNLPSAIVAHVLDPQPGECIIDGCASPGGKTTHIAQLMNDSGVIIACDRSERKAQDIANTAAKLGLKCITAVKCDFTKAVLDPTQCSSKKQLKSYPPESFDKVLLDPPCSALGLRPKLRETITVQELDQAADYQKKLIHSAVRLLKPGGTLVYSTCTLNPKENELQIARALESYPLELLPQSDHLRVASAGLPNCGLDETQRQLVQRFTPTIDGHWNGFFIAKLKKTQSMTS
eukprot:GFYU01032748.1.p1 GENE.GFYU01032748.1~~GFYU01032748.1.p1  ORF type:complete len:477 (+),score=78.80 GFYU01032748.1:59-1432(+)